MRLCFLVVHISLLDPASSEKLAEYHTVFSEVERTLRSAAFCEPSEEDRMLARQCLWRIQTAELTFGETENGVRGEARPPGKEADHYASWSASFDAERSLYGDSLVEILHKTSGDDNWNKFRVRRILETSPSGPDL